MATKALTDSSKNQSKVAPWDMALIAGFVLLASLAIWMLISHLGNRTVQPGDSLVEQTAFEEETGIRVNLITLTAAGGFLDLHYQILDPDKSLVVHDDVNPPTIINEADGRHLNATFHEHGFKELHTARTYRLHIMNSDNVLQRGDRVTLTVGDARLEHILVQ